MVNFKTINDGIIHTSTSVERKEILRRLLQTSQEPDLTSCMLMLVTNPALYNSQTSMALNYYRAVATDERATCVLCLGA